MTCGPVGHLADASLLLDGVLFGTEDRRFTYRERET